jgi:hypothetical protein
MSENQEAGKRKNMHNTERNEGPLAGIAARWIDTVEDERGALQEVSFKNTEHFNFA